MADYPGAVYAPRTKENKSGVVYDPLEATTLFAEDVVKDDAEIVAIETELGLNPKGIYATVKAFLTHLTNLLNGASSPMINSGGVITNGTNAGTFKVASLVAYLRSTDSVLGVLTRVTLAEQDNQAITLANTTYFIILNYNAGSPTITISETSPTNTNAIPIGKVMKDGSDNVHYISGGYRLGDGVKKLHTRAKTLRNLELAGGSVISYFGINNFKMTAGLVYGGINEFVMALFDSSITQFTPVYGDGGAGFTYGAKSNVIDYEHYDDGDGTLGNIGVAKYGVFWVYKHVDDGHVFVIYGTSSYSLGDAETAQEPTKPDLITDFGILIGKIIAPQAGGSFTVIQMVTDTFFVGTNVSNHAQLSNLQGGAVGEYNHLTDAQITVVGNTFGENTGDQTLPVKATGAEINTGTDDAKFATPEAIADSKISMTDGIETLTNKRITARVTPITSHATPTVNTDNCDVVTITAQAEAITNMSTNLSGNETNFQKLIFRILDNGTAREITWGTAFEPRGVALPTTTTISKLLTVGFIYDTVDSIWGCVAVSEEA